jgi:hypothetical protein
MTISIASRQHIRQRERDFGQCDRRCPKPAVDHLWAWNGKLCQGVKTFVTSHPSAERFEFAERNDGGTGVTVAYCRS